MHRDRDFGLDHELPRNHEALIQDVELDTLIGVMAAGDQFLLEVAKRALLVSVRQPDEVVYRQQILTDCLNNASVARELYALAREAIKAEKSVWGGLYRDSPSRLLSTSVQKMELLLGFLKKLQTLADEHAVGFHSPGFTRFFAMLEEELDDQYFEVVERYLKELKFKGGLLFSAGLASGNKGRGYILRRIRDQGWLGRVFDRSGYSFTIPERDESGYRALSELEDKAVNQVANALAQSVEHVLSFFVMVRIEVGFYVACVNLSEHLAARGEPTCLPVPVDRDGLALSGEGLYDVSLVLTLDHQVVDNDIDADGKSLIVITGANQGGKSTFLRSVGTAQLMMQAGMFVGARSFRASVCDGLFTHYKREEDERMESGKLDEELARMSEIVDAITANCVLLCNESFAATNEREGSEIARQVVRALLSSGVRVLYVTHMFDLADGFRREHRDSTLFLRAARGTDGARSFKLSAGTPLPTSYGEDSYRKVFGKGIESSATGVPDATRR
jgi:DNA mismatch repair ATPase MutS